MLQQGMYMENGNNSVLKKKVEEMESKLMLSQSVAQLDSLILENNQLRKDNEELHNLIHNLNTPFSNFI